MYQLNGRQDSSIGITIRCDLNYPVIESRCVWDFPHPSRPALRSTQPPIQLVPGIPGVKRPGRVIYHPTSFRTGVIETVELYFFSPFGHSWPVLGWKLTLLNQLEEKNSHIKLPDIQIANTSTYNTKEFFALRSTTAVHILLSRAVRIEHTRKIEFV